MSTDNDILVVDDHIPSLRLLTELLEKEGYRVRPAEKAQAALDSAVAIPPGLILLDVRIPDMDGYEICRRLKQNTRTAHVPVIFVSALHDAEAKGRGFQVGGVDYVSKPFEESEVLARVKTHMQLHQLQWNLEKIVEKRTAEVTESDSRFTCIVENANEAIVVTQDEAVKYCNPKISELTGYSPEEMYSLAFDAFIHPSDLEVAKSEHRSRLSGERPKNSYSLRLIKRNGQERHVLVNSALISWDGKPAALAMITDITERQLAQKELFSSEQRFRNLMEQSPLDIVLLTPKGQISEVNEAWLRNWDVQADEADKIMAAYNMRTDRQFADLGLDQLVERAFTGENVVLPPLRYIPSRMFDDVGLEDIEARERWIQSHIYSIKDTSGGVESVVVINMDITDLKRAEAEVLSTEARFQNLVGQSPMPLEILSLEGKIIHSNASWRKLWNINEATASEVMDKYNMRTDPQLKKLGINHLVEKAFSGEHIILPPIIYDANETVADFDIENLIGLKSPWIQCHLYPIKDTNGKIVNIVNTYIDISDLKNAETELRNAYEKIKELKDQLEAESTYLQEEIKLVHNFENIIGQSESLKYVLNRVEQVASTESPVLIMGKTGTGKELIARAIHELSPRGRRALIKINCAALPAELVESELFGREKGAFTGATTTQQGRFELATRSTLFLDEIGELPLELQAKLLRVLDDGEFERLGSPRTLFSNARIIAATNRVLEEEVKKGTFREDLWYRLKVFPITVPSLRERQEDIPLLAKWFVTQSSKKMGRPDTEIPKGTMQQLLSYPWPGNVRELKNIIEGALITSRGKKLKVELPRIGDQVFSNFKPFEEMEHDYILQVLKAKKWKIGGENSAASTLNMHVNTLRGRMKKLGIKKPKTF